MKADAAITGNAGDTSKICPGRVSREKMLRRLVQTQHNQAELNGSARRSQTTSSGPRPAGNCLALFARGGVFRLDLLLYICWRLFIVRKCAAEAALPLGHRAQVNRVFV